MAVLDILLIALGPFVGSFLGVIADRWPREEDILFKPSACRACGRRLRAWDLIPVLSFVLQRGQCRTCGTPIPRFAPLAEVLGFFAAIWAVLGTSGPWDAVWMAVLLWSLVGLALTDALHMVLPDPLNLTLFASALLVADDVWLALLGAALGAGSFGAIRIAYAALRGREGLGLGDVKLMAGLGAFVGPLALPLQTGIP